MHICFTILTKSTNCSFGKCKKNKVIIKTHTDIGYLVAKRHYVQLKALVKFSFNLKFYSMFASNENIKIRCQQEFLSTIVRCTLESSPIIAYFYFYILSATNKAN